MRFVGRSDLKYHGNEGGFLIELDRGERDLFISIWPHLTGTFSPLTKAYNSIYIPNQIFNQK